MKLGWQNGAHEQALKMWVELIDAIPGTGKGVCCHVLVGDPSLQATHKAEIFETDEQRG